MKITALVLLALAIGFISNAADMKSEDQRIDDYLSNCEDFLPAWRGPEVTSAQVIRESDAFTARYLELFREMLKKNGLGGREDLVASKGKVFEQWRKQRAVLLRIFENKGLTLFRYDGGKNQPFGYVLFKEGRAFRLLSLGVHRPDPNIGDVDLPFPISG